MRTIGVVVAVLLSSGLASADQMKLADRMWPSVPTGHELSMEDQITDHLTEWGNQLGNHLDLLSHDLFSMRVDARMNRAHMRLGGGNGHYLALHIDSDWFFHDGLASVQARVDLSIHGHRVNLELPDFEMVPSSYQDNRYVEIRIPLFKRSF